MTIAHNIPNDAQRRRSSPPAHQRARAYTAHTMHTNKRAYAPIRQPHGISASAHQRISAYQHQGIIRPYPHHCIGAYQHEPARGHE